MKAKRPKRDRVVRLRVTPEQKRVLREAARNAGLTMSSYIRLVCNRAIEEAPIAPETVRVRRSRKPNRSDVRADEKFYRVARAEAKTDPNLGDWL